MKRPIYAMVLLSLLAICSGCVAATIGVGAGAGVGTYSYIKGELKAIYSIPIEQAWPSTLTALESLQLTVNEQHMDSLGGKIEAQRTNGTAVKVHLTPVGERSTSITVRVGRGSKPKSQRIHNTISKQIGAER